MIAKRIVINEASELSNLTDNGAQLAALQAGLRTGFVSGLQSKDICIKHMLSASFKKVLK